MEKEFQPFVVDGFIRKKERIVPVIVISLKIKILTCFNCASHPRK